MPEGRRDDPAAILAERVSCEGGYKPFGEMTLADVEARAAELGAAAEVPAMAQPIAGVASAWRGLAQQLREAGAETVAELDHEGLSERAQRLRIIPPGGGFL